MHVTIGKENKSQICFDRKGELKLGTHKISLTTVILSSAEEISKSNLPHMHFKLKNFQRGPDYLAGLM